MSRAGEILKRFGPGLITASIVLGPGSIVASSDAGARGEYRLVWVLVGASVLMAAYTAMGARLGCALDTSPLEHVSRRAGRWLAVLVGLSAFLVTAGFQFGNNLGVAFAASGLVGGPVWIWPLVFTGLSLSFLFAAKHLYRWLERFMMVLVGLMILAFFTNLFWTGVDLPKLALGLVPRWAAGDAGVARAMLATTFSVVAAFYQAYLVQAKGWRREDLPSAIRDAWLGIGILGLIAIVILVGSAQTLYGTGTITNVGQLAAQLAGTLGPAANVVFCCGLAAASFSSFLVNALIGGHMLADGLGLDSRMNSLSAKVLASGVMLIGCSVAVATVAFGYGTTASLLTAQASTLIAAPLCAVLLFFLTCRRNPMGELRNRWGAIVLGAVGLAVILSLNAMGLPRLLERLFGAQ